MAETGEKNDLATYRTCEFSGDIESDSVPEYGQKPFNFGKHIHEHYGDGVIRPSRTKSTNYCDSAGSMDSGFDSTASAVTLSSNTSSVVKSSSSNYSTRSSESTVLSSTFSDLQISDTDKKCIPSNQNYIKSSQFYDVVGTLETVDHEPVKELHSEGLQLTSEAFKVNQDGDMSLHLTIIFLNTEVALILISLLPAKYLNHANNLLQTPLHLSVLTRQPRITRALILAGASPDIPDRNGNTALHLACSNNYLDCVGALTHRVTVKESRDYLGERTSLILLQIPQSLELKNYEGYTCTHIATFNGNRDLLAYLVQHGANINAADDKSGRRPLHYVVEMGNRDLVEFLVRRLGANINSTTFDLNTPLHLAAGRDNDELVYLLMDCGASRQAVNSEGLTPHQVTKSDKLKAALKTIEYSDFTITGI